MDGLSHGVPELKRYLKLQSSLKYNSNRIRVFVLKMLFCIYFTLQMVNARFKIFNSVFSIWFKMLHRLNK